MHRRGLALISALFLTVFVFILVSLLFSAAYLGGGFAAQEEQDARAYSVARSGLVFYRVESEIIPVDTTIHNVVPDRSYNQSFDLIKRSASGDVVSVGVVRTLSGRMVAHCTLTARGGDFADVYQQP